jgi:F-type H+-transporting ATPase subunit epsilon
MALSVNIVTAEQSILAQDDVQKIVVPATDGQITILPSHASLMTSLAAGSMTLFGTNGVETITLAGGFLQVLNNEVNILADVPEDEDET